MNKKLLHTSKYDQEGSVYTICGIKELFNTTPSKYEILDRRAVEQVFTNQTVVYFLFSTYFK